MGKKTNTKKGSMKHSFLAMTVLPILALGIVITIFISDRFSRSVYTEVENELENTAYMVKNMYERMYPGDYSVISKDNLSTLLKGDKMIMESIDFLFNIKEDTRSDITFFYGDVRYVSTLVDSEGNSLLGTSVNYAIREKVLEGDEASFFKSVRVDDVEYAAYYMPIHNADKSTVGMLGIMRQTSEIKKLVRRSVTPVLVIAVIGMVIAGGITTLYSQNIIRVFERIKRFFLSVERGELRKELDTDILSRDDELGEMGRAAVNMQKSIRLLIENDALTGLYNRRYANKQFESVINESVCAVAIGDIDFFKKFNDTYGHDIGDKVLITVSSVLKNYMSGKGFVARWGGEEFLFVFTDKYAYKAESCLNELLGKIHEIEIEFEESLIKVNMSFGVLVPEEGKRHENTDVDEMLKAADEYLYYAKSHGRNQVVAGTIKGA